MDTREQRYGFQVVIPTNILNRIIAEALKLEDKDVQVYLSEDYIHRSRKVIVISKDSSLPALREGCEPAYADLRVLAEPTPEGGCVESIEGVEFPRWGDLRD
jgi:hypothetical protein